jgi:hypothetical protein
LPQAGRLRQVDIDRQPLQEAIAYLHTAGNMVKLNQ